MKMKDNKIIKGEIKEMEIFYYKISILPVKQNCII
jgi:hypothetical protein